MRLGEQDGIIEIHWLLYIFHCGNWNQQGGCVPLMWCVVCCCGLVAFHMAGQNLKEICYS